MFSNRLNTAIRTRVVEPKKEKKWLHLFPEHPSDFSVVMPLKQVFFHSSFSVVQKFISQGIDGGASVSGIYDNVVVHLPQSKRLAQHLVFLASEFAPQGVVYVDGAKTQGVESIMKAVRKLVPLEGQVSGRHGRLFWFMAKEVFAPWDASAAKEIDGGFKTRAGTFSSEHVDPGSELLAKSLPNDLSGVAADLGAGWGYLSHCLLKSFALISIDLVEVDLIALDCAKINCNDKRARFHWRDIETWFAPKVYDHVVMNPPFHAGRQKELELGRVFIKKASTILKKKGKLWMVANRHLPYEETLSQLFVDFREIAGDNRFKVLQATECKV